LSDASFLLANLSGVNLSNVILVGTNFWQTNLSGQDFTVVSEAIHGSVFIEANLKDVNFEGVNLSPPESFTSTFKNKAHLKQETVSTYHNKNLVLELFDIGLDNIHILSAEVSGNDLVVSYVFYNNFAYAKLENANFKNASLWIVDFYSANLTNANLSGADLRKSLLVNTDLSNANLQDADISGADLSGADLSDANLSGVIYDQYTILKCVNHDICV
jgi:uncharacterized protein YjbI with pentapeptide repeats